jgi:hypothetical protein
LGERDQKEESSLPLLLQGRGIRRKRAAFLFSFRGEGSEGTAV